jgi:hypothetical protein
MDKTGVMRWDGKYVVPATIAVVVIGLAMSAGAFIGSLPRLEGRRDQLAKTSPEHAAQAVIKPAAGTPDTERSDEETKSGWRR